MRVGLVEFVPITRLEGDFIVPSKAPRQVWSGEDLVSRRWFNIDHGKGDLLSATGRPGLTSRGFQM